MKKPFLSINSIFLVTKLIYGAHHHFLLNNGSRLMQFLMIFKMLHISQTIKDKSNSIRTKVSQNTSNKANLHFEQ